MKTIKSKTFITYIMLVFASLACLLQLFWSDGSVISAAASDYAQSQSAYFNVNTAGTFNLFASDSSTTNYYGISFSSGSKLTKSSGSEKSLNANRLYLKIHYYGLSGTKGNVTTFSTRINLNERLVSLSQSGQIQVLLKASLSSESGDKQYMSWSNGSNSATLDSVITSSSATEVSMDLGTLSSTSLVVNFHSEYVSDDAVDYYQDLTVVNPRLEIIDLNGPNISNVVYASGYALNKTVTFSVNDTVSDFNVVLKAANALNVSVTAPTLSQVSENGGTKNYSFVAGQPNENYTITATDNCSNVSTHVITSQQLQIDTLGITDLTLGNIPNTHEDHIDFEVSYTSDNLSPQSVYYTLLTLTAYELNSELAIPDKTSQTLSVGSNTISFEDQSNGDYVLTAVVIDEVNNVGNIVTKHFKVDQTRYEVNFQAINGVIDSITGAEILEGESTYHAWFNDRVTINYSADEGYEFYALKKGDNTLNASATSYIYYVQDHVECTIKFRYIITIESCLDSYDFDVNGNLSFDYSLNTSALSLAEEVPIEIDYFDVLTTEFSQENEIAFYNAGTYKVVWKVSADNEDFVGNGQEVVQINKKLIEVIYSNHEGLVYDSNAREITAVINADEDISEMEMESLNVEIDYYPASTTTFSEEDKTILKNAGSYKAVVRCANTNYQIANGIIDITISKKDISVINITNTNVNYTASNQEIVFELTDEQVATETKYYKNSDFENSTNFCEAGEYAFKILPVDNVNYNLINNEGTCYINIVEVYFKLNRKLYDYTGNNIVLDYTMYNIDHISGNVEDSNVITYVNGLTIQYYVNEIEVDTFKDASVYKVIFNTSDANYNLHYTTYEEVEIEQTVVEVRLNRQQYEYTGSNITLDYSFLNDNGQEMEDISSISLEIKLGDVSVVEIFSVGEYSYAFTSSDVKIIIENNTGVFNVVKPELIITMNTYSYEYSKEQDYQLDYDIISELGTDFTNSTLLSLSISQDGQVSDLNDVGTYDYTFTSLDENILIISGANTDLSTKINITKKTVIANVTNEYYYTANPIIFKYEIENYCGLSETDIVVTQGTIIEVGQYNYNIVSSNNNYKIEISNPVFVEEQLIITVLPKNIFVRDALSNYSFVYCDLEIDLKSNIVLTEEVEYDINVNGGLTVKNAGTYNISLISTNRNYKIEDRELSIIVSAKTVAINVIKDSFYYNKQEQPLQYLILVDGIEKSIDSHVLYNDSAALPKDAGEYNYSVNIDDTNYSGTKTGILIINKETIQINVVSGQTKIFGSEDQPIKYFINNMNEQEIEELSIILSRASGDNVGNYKIILDSYSSLNYIVEYNTEDYYTIVAKKVIIIADAVSKTFGDIDPDLTYKIYMDGGICNSLLNGEVLSGSLQREVGEDVGRYEIKVGTLQHNNYQILFVKNNLTINKKDLTVKIDNKEVVYGEQSELTYAIEQDYDAQYITGDIARLSGSDVGEYEIHQGSLTSQNYNLIVTNGTYKIISKPLQVVAVTKTKYYGDPDSLEYTATGLINNDVLAGQLSRETGEDVGIYAITVGTLNNCNYAITFIPNVLIIQKAPIVITIDSKQQVYGEEEVPLTYSIEGLKNSEHIDLDLFRQSGKDVGEYAISYVPFALQNYNIDNMVAGNYIITKGFITPTLKSSKVVYNGNAYQLQANDFPYALRYTYTMNGFEVDNPIAAGTYSVNASFDGNENYFPSTSNDATLIIEKQYIYFTLNENNFIFDGTIKYPKYSYDKTTGLNENAIICQFENDINPIEVGEYNFVLKIQDNNFKGETQGVVRIEKPFTVTNDHNSILECAEATFDEKVKRLTLLQSYDQKTFKNEKVLSVCTLGNVESSELISNYVYTVRVKATQGVEKVKVYKVSSTSVDELAVTMDNGYYVFQFSDPNDKYIITTDIRTLSTLAWILILSGTVLLFGITILVILRKKRKKVKLAKALKKSAEAI